MKIKLQNLALVFFIFLFSTNCSITKYVFTSSIKDYLQKPFVTWTIDDCNKIIKYYSVSTKKSIPVLSKRPDISITALPLNKNVIQALAKKEAIEQRLNNTEYIARLKELLEQYTSFTLDTVFLQIMESDSNFTKGYSFKLYLENQTDPFKPIFLEDGYSYFFLENMNGKFSRIIEVTGLYAEDFIQLDNYLNVVVTFSPFATDGTRLFKNKDLSEAYKLVFNGLQEKPIVIEGNLP